MNKYIEALEQESILNKIRAEIEQMDFDFGDFYDHTSTIIEMILTVIDKYKIESNVFVPKNVTNGDMINALFPNAKNIKVDGGYPLNFIIEWEWHRNLKEWWDTPYNSESENKE